MADAGEGVTDGPGASVFVSYSRTDQKAALPVVHALEEAGHSVWWDGMIEGGERYLKATEAALEGASAVVVLWSTDSVASHWVQDEAMRGRDRGCLVPLTIDGTQPPLGFRQFQTIDFSRRGRKARGEALGAMLHAVAALAGRPAPESGAQRTTGVPPRLARLPLWVAILVLGLLGAAGWWLLRPEPMRLATVSIQRFGVIGAGVPPDLPQRLDADLRSKLSDDRVPVEPGAADLELGGSVRSEAGGLRFSLAVARPGEAPIFTFTHDLAAGRPIAELVNYLSGFLTCSTGFTRYRGRLADGAQALVLQYCMKSVAGGPGRSPGEVLDLARTLTREAPDFSFGWAILTESANLTPLEQRTEALRREGWEAARRAIELDPQSTYALVHMALLVPANEPLERERLMRRAVELSDAGDGTPFLSGFPQQLLGLGLIQSGRFRDALPFLQRAADQDRSSGRSQIRLALVHYLMGNRIAGDAAYERWQAGPVQHQAMRPGQLLRANLLEDWAGAASLVEALRPEDQMAFAEAYAGLESGDPDRIAAAGVRLGAIPIDSRNETTIVPLLAALGRADSVFAAFDRSIRIGGSFSGAFASPGASHPLVYDPRFHPIRRDPRFAAHLRRAGFYDYWRATHSRPDECGAAQAPPYCAELARR
jgi:tetratricopeptide (TPR) repeat protein